MNTFTQILSKINWVDVAMLVLLIRIVFIGIKTGFVTELFKLFGIICALYIGLHYYSFLAQFLTKKTNWSLDSLEFVFFVLLVCCVVLIVKFLRDGFLMVFKFETTHSGVNQWGAAILSVLRALTLISIILYGILLTRVEWMQRQTLSSISQKLTLNIAPHTYKFLYQNLFGKIFNHEKFNEDVFNVTSRNSVGRKPF